MAKIKQLSRQMADMIAAGEVVERPASVVKELVENAIDAGAHMITVELERGGTGYLRITDNGSGIAGEDVETAFLRHATSKISTPEDLDGVLTLGFRGEALAAISSVSRMEVLTLAEGEQIGTSLELEGGVVTDRSEAGCPRGTTMIVRDLFYNTPARMKFLKRDATEAAQVAGVVQRAALSHPEISFRLIRDGKTELHTPGDRDLKSTVYHVFGKEFSDTLTPLSSEFEGIRIRGFITRPDGARGNRTMQHFFVNGRAVRSKILMSALEAGYKNAIPGGRFPGCVLQLEISPHRLDVNIHPTKAEIKFQQERQVFDALYYAVKDALEADQTRPELQLSAAAGRKPGLSVKAEPKKDFWETIPARDFQKKAAAPPAPRTEYPVRPVYDRPSAVLPVRQPERPFDSGPVRALTPDPEIPKEPAPGAKAPDPVPPAEQEPAQPVQTPMEEGPEPYRYLGETMETYLLVEQGDKLLLIDKHAAHERVLYEQMKERAGEIPTQLLLAPVPASLSKEDTAALLEEQEFLKGMGFLVEDFGGALLIRGVPADVDQADPAVLLSGLAEQLRGGSRLPRMELRDRMLYTMACKAAIKGGWKTGEEELRRLVDRVLQTRDIRHCPHGRPVLIEISKGQLERQFERS